MMVCVRVRMCVYFFSRGGSAVIKAIFVLFCFVLFFELSSKLEKLTFARNYLKTIAVNKKNTHTNTLGTARVVARFFFL